VVSGAGPTGASIVNAVTVGDQITYVVRVSAVSGRDVRIGKCWATDDVSQIDLADDHGCSVQVCCERQQCDRLNNQTTNSVWSNFRRDTQPGTNDIVFYATIKAWAFPTSHRVNLFCNMHTCTGTCPASQCRTTRLRRVLDERTSTDGRPAPCVFNV
jgi:hypothetical protein